MITPETAVWLHNLRDGELSIRNAPFWRHAANSCCILGYSVWINTKDDKSLYRITEAGLRALVEYERAKS